jgi:hypothetical protein
VGCRLVRFLSATRLLLHYGFLIRIFHFLRGNRRGCRSLLSRDAIGLALGFISGPITGLDPFIYLGEFEAKKASSAMNGKVAITNPPKDRLLRNVEIRRDFVNSHPAFDLTHRALLIKLKFVVELYAS